MALSAAIGRLVRAAAVALVLATAGGAIASAQDQAPPSGDAAAGATAEALAAGASAIAQGASIAAAYASGAGTTAAQGATTPEIPPVPIPQCAPAQTLIVAGMPIVIPCPGVTFPSGGSAAA